MLEKRIKLNDLKDKSDFLNIASSLECDVDIRYGGQVFDAKSVMAILQIDINGAETIRVRVHTDDENILNKFKRWFV